MIRFAIGIAAILLACTPKKPKIGDVCGAADEGSYTCTSASEALLCKAERLVHRDCRGPNGCAANKCDRSIGREGDACSERNAGYYDGFDVVCTEDRKALLVCRDGKLAIDARCRGPNGCTGAGYPITQRSCDQTLGEVGDPCNRNLATNNTLGACSVDKKSSLSCDRDDHHGGKLVVSKTCDKGCSVGPDPFFPVPICD